MSTHRTSLRDLSQQLLDLCFQLFDLGVDLFEGAGWDVFVEVAGEGDLVAGLGLVVVDPGVRDVGVDLGGEVVVNGGAVLDRLT